MQTARYIDLGIEQTVELIGSFNMAFPVRLHGAVVSYLMETPFAFLEYEEKCNNFSKDIGIPGALRLDPQSGVTEWELAAEALLAGTLPSMSAIDYKTRAKSAYFGDHDAR